MNPDNLLKHFDQISEAPDAIPRLRRFILDLAVRGKLVEQDLNDEPASELLKKIQVEKKRLVKKDRDRTHETNYFDEEDIEFSIPNSWAWTSLEQVGVINPRNDNKGDIDASFIPMSMIFAEYGKQSKHEVRPWSEIKTGFTHFAEGDVGLAKITPCFENGKSTVFRNLTGGMGAGTTELHIVRPIIVSADYILLFLKSSHFIQNGIIRMTGTAGQKRVPRDYFAFSPFPLPPLAEQRRIVAGVDELMTLCDELEAAQTKRERRRDLLVAASLNGLNKGMGGDQFRQNAGFYLNHLPSLATRPEHIHQLRRTILNLAVRGKLIPQNSNDEPVALLLNRIDQDRAVTAKSDGRAEAESQGLLGDDLRWEVPRTWGWRALADLVLFIDYRGKTPSKTGTGVRLITAKNVRRGFINSEPEEFISEATYEGWMTRGLPRSGDILFTTEAPLGNAAVVRIPEKFGLAQRVINFHPYADMDSDFLMLELLSGAFQAILNDASTGLTAKGIKAAKLKRLPFTVPPLAEQHRIVKKADELMTVCDKLETHIKNTTTARRQFLEAALHKAPLGHHVCAGSHLEL